MVGANDIYFAFGSDEETGGYHGAAAIARSLEEQGIKFDMILDEGGCFEDIECDGHTYSATSYGIYNALRRLSAIYGLPTWEGGIPVRVKQIARGANRIFTLDVVRK